MTRKKIGILAGTLLILGVSVYWGLKFYIENNARSFIQQWANQTDRIAGLSYQSLDAGLFSKTVQVSQVSLQIKDMDSPVAIDRLILHSFDTEHDIPCAMHVEMQGIHISRSNSLIKGILPVLSQLGYSDIVGSLEYAYRYDSIKKYLEIQQVLIRVADMGRLEVKAQLNNLDLAAVKSVPDNPLSLIALVPAVAISGITLKYQDHSLVKRFIQLGARQSGQSEEQFVSGITNQLNLEIQKQKQPAARNALLSLQNFIKNPGALEAAIAPAQPFPLMRFAMLDNVEQLVALMNISLTYQEIQK